MKGFTLIELLAVIIILAIILLISYPLISNIIESVKRNAFESSVRLLVKAAENEFAKDSLTGGAINKNFQFENSLQIGSDTLEFSGRSPEDGYINIRPDGKADVAITDGTYCATKLYTDEDLSIRKLADGESCVPTGEFTMSSCKFENSATHLTTAPAGFIPIYTVEDLININSNLRGNYILMNDLDLSGYPDWTPIGDENNWKWFSGIFDGNGYSINNLNIISDYDYYQGLFAGSVTAHFKNLGLRNFNISGYASSSGGLVGYVDVTTTIENVNVVGTIETGYNIGGIVGDVDGSIMFDESCADITVTGNASDSTEYFGGLLGHNYYNTYVTNSYVLMDFNELNDASYAVGGLIGGTYQTNVIENSYVEGTFSGAADSTGGLIGEAEQIRIRNSYVKANFTNTSSSNPWDIGGLIGFHSNTSNVIPNDLIENSYYVGNINYTTGGEIGGLIGYGEIINIKNTYVKGNIFGTNYIGGLIGFSGENFVNTNSIVYDKVFYEGNITGEDHIGGIFGYTRQNNVLFDDSYSKSNLSGINNVGGLTGTINSDIVFDKYYHFGTITGTTNTNGIVGFFDTNAESTTFSDVYWNSELSGISTSQRGSVGLNTSDFTNSASFNNFDFSNDWMVNSESPSFKNFNEETPWSPQGNSPVATLSPLDYDLKSTSTFPNNCSEIGTPIQGTIPDGYVAINTPEEFYEIRNNLSGKYILMHDINLESYESWNPIGNYIYPFIGELDGNGFNICNMQINSELASYNAGLFGGTNASAVFKNVKMHDFKINVSSDTTGNLVGRANNTSFTNISYTGDHTYKGMFTFGLITGRATSSTFNTININATIDSPQKGNYIGGVSGLNNSTTFTNVTFDGEIYFPIAGYIGGIAGNGLNVANAVINADITGAENVGGMVGLSFGGGITGSIFNGNIFSNGNSAGGLIAWTNGGDFSISNSHVTGTVEGVNKVGGLCGESHRLKVANSYSTANVKGNSSVGGLVGTGSSYYTYTDPRSFKIENSYSTGNITGGENVGGILGSSSQGAYINKSYYTGTITATGDNVGGLVGYSENFGSFYFILYAIDSYANASISGNNNIGGLFGSITGKAGASHYSVYNYFTGTISANSVKGGVVAAATYAQITSSYWNTTSSGVATSAGGTALTDAQMRVQSNFTSWDFTNNWIMDTYPKLRWE